MSVQTITQTLSPLTVFPSRSNYTSSSAYGFAVENWLNTEQTLNTELMAFRGQLNTSITEFNTHFDTIDDYIASATQSAQSAAEDAEFCAGVSATLAEGTINDSATGLTTAWSSSKLNTLLSEKLNASAYTASDVLAKLKTVDGAGSGLDADLLDGKESATAGTANTVALRDAVGDLTSRAFISTLAAQSTTPASTVNMFFRDTDNTIKPLTATAFKAWLESIGATGMKIKNKASFSEVVSGTNLTLPFTITDVQKCFITFQTSWSNVSSGFLIGLNKAINIMQQNDTIGQLVTVNVKATSTTVLNVTFNPTPGQVAQIHIIEYE